MEAQHDQQPNSVATARPKQPTDALAASLPTETLAQIFHLALKGSDARKKHQAKLALAKTCVGWYAAAEMGRALEVADTMKAERLGKALREQGDESMERVRSLCVSIEIKPDFAPGYQRAAALISACPRLEKLELQVGGFEFEPSPGPLAGALEGLPELREFSISTSFETTIPAAVIHGFLKSWPRLEVLNFRKGIRIGREGEQVPALPPLAITRLRLPIWFPLVDPLLAPLLVSVSTSLCHLHLPHTFPFVGLNPGRSAPDLDSVVAVAPQLLSLTAISQGISFYHMGRAEYWWSTLTALRDVQTLRLGCLGYPLGEILPLLQQLQHLAVLSISDPLQPVSGDKSTTANTLPFHQLTSTAALEFIAEASALRALTLPCQLELLWSRDGRASVEAAAQRKRVHFRLD